MWECENCGEKQEDQFDCCWQCGRESPHGITPPPIDSNSETPSTENSEKGKSELSQDDIRKIALAAGPHPTALLTSIAILAVGVFLIFAKHYYGSRPVLINYVPLSWLCVFIGIAGLLIEFPFRRMEARRIGAISIKEDGIWTGKQLITWNEIIYIYHYTVRDQHLFFKFLGPISEKRVLKIKTSDGREMSINFTRGGCESEDVAEPHKKLVNKIISKTVSRHIKEFISNFRAGKIMKYHDFTLRRDGLVFSGYKNGRELLPLSRLSGFHIDKRGVVYIEFLNREGKSLRKKLGDIRTIPNPHIFINFLEGVVAGRNRKVRNEER